MTDKELLVAKAKAKTLAHHFKKAAAHHEAKAAAHLKLHEAHKAHAEHHSDMADQLDGDESKVHKAHHKAAKAFHMSKAAHHEKLHKAHSAYAEHHKAMAAAHSEMDDHEKVFKLAGMEDEPLTTRPITDDAVAKSAADKAVADKAAADKAAADKAAADKAAASGSNTETSINETIQKALDNKLTEAVSAAFERVLSSQEFNQKVDQAIAGKLLEKLGSSTVDTPIKTFAVPRTPETSNVNRAAVIDTSALDPELADLCKMD